MAGSNVQYSGSHPFKTKRVYYNGATALAKNQPLTYVEDASTLATLEAAEAANPGSQNFGLARGVQVETPATASLLFLAGILQDGDEGKANGEWVTIIVPQSSDLITVRVEGTTDIAVGDPLEITDGNPYFTNDGTFAAASTLMYALEAFTTNAEGLILARKI